jgi:hypothetical protein
MANFRRFCVGVAVGHDDEAQALVYGNPLIDMIRTRGGVDPDQVVNDLGEALARELGNPACLPLQTILFEATRP